MKASRTPTAPPPPPPPAYRLLTIREVAKALRVSVRTVQRWRKRGLLPSPVRLSEQKVFWRESDLQQLLDARAAEGQANAPEKVPLVQPTGRKYAP